MTNDVETIPEENGFEIAVIGMAGRFPGASDIDRFWENLCNGVESISTFTDEEILDAGIDPGMLSVPEYVKAGGILDDVDMFDAAFFKYSHREAKTMDPQHRLFLECAYESLQNAGYDPRRYRGLIGVFAGVSSESYSQMAASGNAGNAGMVDGMQTYIGNDRNFLSTRVSYKLNLKGPSFTVQTACSTSLVAAHLAYQSLLCGECDIAMAGGVSIHFPQKVGYIYEKEGILSPDGHCRAFDAQAEGTIGGEGVGIVVLKRLGDALADGDCIHAVIKGSALNNDGSRKVGFTAPSVEGQADVIARAQAMAEVEPDTIGYIETHGTGTQLGDPIEIAALTKAFRGRGSEKQHFCAIGSVKTNIGHLDATAGVVGLIKAVLTLNRRKIPPSLHYREANPQLDFVHSPFYVNNSLTEWQASGTPLRAGVSSFGIGGSNAHMVLEEAPRLRSDSSGMRTEKLLLISANTDTALDRSCEDLVAYMKAHPDLPLADIAFTLQVGRQQFKQRRMLVSDETSDAIEVLEVRDPKRVIDGSFKDENRPVVFMFPGQGSQYVDMGRGLYEVEPEFREVFDECCELLKPHLGIDLRELVFTTGEDAESAIQQINQTSLTQPALFAIEYSLARLWISWGVQPQAMIGHSIGEYVAACLAGVFSLPDALSLVSARARMMQSMDTGSMLAIPIAEDEVRKLLDDGLSVAAINEPSLCVVSGTTERVNALETELAKQDVECRQLHTSHAFHSMMMESMLKPFEELVRGIEIGKPKIPYISNLTGTWVKAEEITDPAYWSSHLRNTVQFAAGLETLFENPLRVFLEVGPGQTLGTLVRKNPSKGPDHLVISSMRHPKNQLSDGNVLMNCLGRLWLAGMDISWSGFYGEESRHRIPLPSYPFERQRFWLEQQPQPQQQEVSKPSTKVVGKNKIADLGRWFYAPGWKSSIAPYLSEDMAVADGSWLVFSDSSGIADSLTSSLKEMGAMVSVVTPADKFSCLDSSKYTVRPGQREDMVALFAELGSQGSTPNTILHLWSVAPQEPVIPTSGDEEQGMTGEFYSVLHLAQSLAEDMPSFPVELIVVTSGTQLVTGSEVLCPDRAAVLGLCRVLPQEQDRLRCRTIDIEASGKPGYQKRVADQLLAEVSHGASDQMVALRHNGRWVQVFEPVFLDEPRSSDQHLRVRGVYLITGGFGNIGLSLGYSLAQAVGARLILVSRSELPPRESWDEQLSSLGEDSIVGQKILAVRAIEEAGAEVLALSADVSNEAQMRAVVERAVAEYGQINGVIHAAATADQQSFQLFRDLDREACELQFLPKIKGLQVLDKVLEGQAPDFCIIMSSLASMLGGLRFGAYASANAFMDVFAQSRFGQGSLPWLSVNWDGWHFGDPESGSASAVARLSMTAEEGLNVLARLLGVKAVPQMTVSTWDLQARLEQWAKPLEAMHSDSSPSADVSRPNDRSGPAKFETKQEEVERRLCDIWTELLGVEGISADDNFFDLGGDSLLALQVTSRLRQGLIADLSAATVLEAPTIAELTQHVIEQQQSMNSSDQVTEMLQQIKSISPEERERLLAEARQARGAGK